MHMAIERRFMGVWFAALAFVFGGASHAVAKVRVVATTADLGALVRAVGGDEVEVTVLAEPSEDPHYVDPRPSFLVALSRAELLVVNGLELEVGWLPPLLVNARNPKVLVGATGFLDASTLVKRVLGVPRGQVDRAMGDIHQGGNPHYTTSPFALADVARGLVAPLARLLPTSRAALAQRAEAVATRLTQLASSWRQRFDALDSARRRVVVYHESYPYLVDWLGLSQVAAVENKPGIKPSPAHVADVMRAMRAQGVKVILQEEWHADATSKTLARLTSGVVVALPGGARGGQAIEAHVEAVARRVYDAVSR